MIEFGEKIKRLREEKGMTQQTMADLLFVTRQAVSRWECGARYPDLLTTKKIAEVLETSIDELVSGQELKREIEKEPILCTPVSNYIQTVLYTLGALSYLFIDICLCYMAFKTEKSVYPDPFTILGYSISLLAMLAGIFFSVRNEISPRKIGIILSVEFLRIWFVFIGVCSYTVFMGNGEIAPATWFSLACNVVELILIIRFFFEKRRVSPIPVYLIGALMAVQKIYYFGLTFFDRQTIIHASETDIDMMVGNLLTLLVHETGQIATLALIICQAYTLDKKRKDAINGKSDNQMKNNAAPSQVSL